MTSVKTPLETASTPQEYPWNGHAGKEILERPARKYRNHVPRGSDQIQKEGPACRVHPGFGADRDDGREGSVEIKDPKVPVPCPSSHGIPSREGVRSTSLKMFSPHWYTLFFSRMLRILSIR